VNPYLESENGVYRVDQIAYEIWTWKASRDAKRTLKLLHELMPDTVETVDLKQIRNWATYHKWGTLADHDIKALAPSIHNETLGGLIIDGLKAQRVLDSMLEDYLDKGKVPERNAIQMVDVTLKYAGMSPMGHRDPTEKARSRGGAASSIVERYLSPEEIARYSGEDGYDALPEHSEESE
jgi:hypothetical protein